jgi:soluble lytic murein transglycosylase
MILARAGLAVDAAWYLRRLVERRRGDRGLALLAARASAEAGDHRAVARLLANNFADFLQRPADALPDDFYALVYPRPFLDAVERAAGGRDLDPAFMFSLMRQESRFDPNARSFVGALGLFQIMPYTATELGPRAGLDGLSAADFEDETVLLQPPVNAAIAATLAGDLFAMFGGALAPVIASYNAGEERVAIWWESARDLPEDLFVDTIPYSETRRFVREVLANVAGYHRVYGSNSAP